jgi:hypothetical protein
LEAGLRAVARCLGIPDPTRGPDRTWGGVLRQIKDRIDAKWPTSGARFSGDGQTLAEIYAALAAIQNPYRDATMHLDHTYSDDDARHIIEMVHGLMRKTADRMDEQGAPLA